LYRILKYHLLLRELLKFTPENHDDYQGLVKASEVIVDVSKYVDEVKRDYDFLSVIEKVRNSIPDLVLPNNSKLSDYGKLLYDGYVNIKMSESSQQKSRYVFVLEKVLIVVKPLMVVQGTQKFLFREAFNLIDYRVETNYEVSSQATRSSFQFRIVKKSGRAAVTLFVKTKAEKEKFLKAFEDAFEVLEPPNCRKTDHKFTVTTFENPTTCSQCSMLLKGLIHQGYKCRLCQICVHKDCIEGRCPKSFSPQMYDQSLTESDWSVGRMENL
jgi:guanine nucleotide exchange factor VAV